MILCKHIFSDKELRIDLIKVNETEKAYKLIDICDCIKNFKIAISKSNLDKVKHTLFGWQMFSTEPKVIEFVHTIEERTQCKISTFDDINKLDKIAKKAKNILRRVRMTNFEKYIKLKDEFSDESCSNLLSTYLHIVQVMSIEERNYKKHRNELVSWLNNIEKAIKESRKGD